MSKYKIPDTLDNIYIISKNEIASLCEIKPVWINLEGSNNNAFYCKLIPDSIYEVSDAVLKVTTKYTGKRTNNYNIYEADIEVLKNIDDAPLVGRQRLGKETIQVVHTNQHSFYRARLFDMKYENYNRLELSPFLRRYCFIPNYGDNYLGINHNAYECSSIFYPLRTFSKDVNTGESKITYEDRVNYIFLVDFKEAISSRKNNHKHVVTCLKKLPIKN